MQEKTNEIQNELESSNLNHENQLKLHSNALDRRDKAKVAAFAKKQEYEDYLKKCDLMIAEKMNNLAILHSQVQENEKKINNKRYELENLKAEIRTKQSMKETNELRIEEVSNEIRTWKNKNEKLRKEINQTKNQQPAAKMNKKDKTSLQNHGFDVSIIYTVIR